jgi:LuxR family glucitol operon transcriptional activator
MTFTSDTFRRLLRAGIASIAASEDKTTARVEAELAQQFGRAGSAIRHYKEGRIPPDAHTIEVLVTAGVQRGYMGREWARRMLSATRYANPDALMEVLFPEPGGHAQVPRVRSNLPPATYSQFIMRDEPFLAVLDGLSRRTAALVIYGLGGTGKTSLAREIAVHCLAQKQSLPRFDTVVWVSDQDRPGTTNLSLVLDTIARVLGFSGVLTYSFEEKRYAVDQMLRSNRMLLVIDNVETITDRALVDWMLRNLPEPSKALITTREYSDTLRGAWPVELRGMRESEAQALLLERLHALGLQQLLPDQSRLTPLLKATGGNPKALTVAVGLLKYRRRPLSQVLDELTAARSSLFSDVFERAWSLLGQPARNVLMAMTLFPGGAGAEALADTADVHGIAFEQALVYLLDLSLLEVQQASLDSEPRYSLHAMVQAFLQRLDPGSMFDLDAARRRQARSFSRRLQALPSAIWQLSERARIIEQEETNLYGALEYALQQLDNNLLADLLNALDDYWTLGIDPALAEYCGLNLPISGSLPDDHCRRDLEIIEKCVWMLLWNNQSESAEGLLQRLWACLEPFPNETLYAYYLFDLGYLHQLRGDLAAALTVWERQIDVANQQNDPQMHIYGRLLIAQTYYKNSEFDQAEQVLNQLFEYPLIQQSRLYADVVSYLALIALQKGDLAEAERYVRAGLEHARQFRYRRGIAALQQCAAAISIQRGHHATAQAQLSDAIDLFERLGMRRELYNARAELSLLARSG